MSRVLIVDDEPSICWGFRELLTEDGHEVMIAASAEEAQAAVGRQIPDAVVLDIRLPGMDGLTAMRGLRDRIGDVPIIVITAFGSLETAVDAVRQGAFDYLTKPFDLERASEVIDRALRSRQETAAAGPESAARGRDALVGASPPMQQVFKQIALAASSDVPVLITGESGTGKELVARAIHRNSPRAAEPFAPICLAALSPSLVESELFGHARGAFTGATSERRGLLELAGGGTVLLDEIGDTSPGVQVKLLRALEEREVAPVGDARPRPIHARLVAATNRPLREMISSGQFREDLFFRLSVFEIALPPLRERLDDIPALAEHFLALCKPAGLNCRMSDEFLAALRSRRWPGNVRELRNAIERAAIVARGGLLGPEHLPPETERTRTAQPDVGTHSLDGWVRLQTDAAMNGPAMAGAEGAGVYERYLALVEPPMLRSILEQCGNNRALAAQRLGIHRATLRQKLRRYGIDVPGGGRDDGEG